MKFEYPEGATPLTYDELANLIPTHITTQDQLNEWEQKNILAAEKWAQKKKDIISTDFIQKLHTHMFNNTWRWAGKFRQSETNIGIDRHLIPVELKKLCDDVNYQLEQKTYPLDEIAVRLHHRLVFIHPFPNGNGRLARLLADLLMRLNGKTRFSWGKNQDLYKTGPIRKQYIDALKKADRGDYTNLIEFARS